MNRYPICLSLFGSTEELLQQIQQTNGADLFEIRLDLSPPVQYEALRSATTKPLLFTAHGHPGMLQQASPYADYLDVEQGEALDMRCIVSIHAMNGHPRKLWMDLPKSHLAKIVLQTENYGEIAELLDLDRAHHPRSFCFAMGEIGAFSRILSVFHGAPWTYACLAHRSTAPGQFTIQELTELYRLPRFQHPPHVFGIVGDPVAHSRSPHFHNERFAAGELPWIYLPFPCKDLRSLFHHAPQWNVAGFSITHPYKEEVLSLLNHRSPEVDELGSCNTVCFKNGEWYGFNTDVAGISEMLKKHQVPLSGSRAVIIGAGGAARAIASVIRPFISELTILNRTPEKAKPIAWRYEGRVGTLEDFDKFPYDLLFQATPIGLKEGECPVDTGLIRSGTTVIDSNYHPVETLLLQKAKEAGCRTINGEAWFDAQAEAQFSWWKQMMLISDSDSRFKIVEHQERP